MNAVAEHLAMPKQVVAEAIAVACQRIAPTWPLDRFIAVNPYWGHVDQPIEEAASQLGLLAGARMMMPRAFYREAWPGGRIQRAHLEEARAEASAMDSAETLIGALEQPEDVDRLPLLSDCLDARSDLSHAPSWREVITHQISQYCAAYFDTDQADWQPARDDGLYAGWRARMQSDHSVTLLMGESDLNAKAGKLPSDRYALIEQALARLEIPQPIAPDYLSALLMSVGGWAAWCAYRRWQA